jgi:hypothetical protein
MNLINKNSKSPLLAKIKFEPTFFQVLWRFAFSLPLQSEAGGRVGEFPRLQSSFAAFWRTKRVTAKPLRGKVGLFNDV